MKYVLLCVSLIVAASPCAEAGYRRSRCRTCQARPASTESAVVAKSSPVVIESPVVSNEIVRESYTSSPVVVQPRLTPSCKDGKCSLRR